MPRQLVEPNTQHAEDKNDDEGVGGPWKKGGYIAGGPGWNSLPFCAGSLCSCNEQSDPFITSISPVSITPGGSDFTLTVDGVNFVSTSTVNWGSTALTTTYISSEKLTATVTASLISGGGTGWITVSSPTPGGGISNIFYLPVAHPISSITVATLQAATGSNPYQIGEGDFNGDGILDLAVSNFNSSGTVSILLGNGDGTFQTQSTFSTLGEPFGFASGDINGDGKLDLIVGNDSSGLNVELGNNDGTFTSSTLSGGNCLLNPVLADVNGDGKPDIVVGNYCSSGVLVYLGNGDGTFQAATTVGTASGPYQVVVGDFNNDGKLDIVAASSYSGSAVTLYLGNGDGTFSAGTSITAVSYPWNISAADFNGDGYLDLAVTSQDNSGITVLLENGNGTFQAPKAVSASGGYNGLTIADLNSDGHLDVIGLDESGNVQVWSGNGDGTFQSPQTVGNAGSFAYGIVAGPFANGGGLGVATPGVNDAVIFLQTVSLSPATQNFGTINQGSSSSAQTFTITNSTANTVHVTGITFTGTNAGDFGETDTCSSPIASGGTCTISVTFTPGGNGSRAATLSVTDDAPSSPQTATLTGTGAAAPVVGLSPAGLSFGNQNDSSTSSSQPITLTNTGNASLAGLSISVTGTNAGDFGQTNNCPSTLTATSFCMINVTFSPSIAGPESGSIHIVDNAGNSPQSASLSGTGVALCSGGEPIRRHHWLR